MKNKIKKNFSLENFIDEKFNLSLSYIKESRKFIYSIIVIFFFFALIGFFVPLPTDVATAVLNYFKDLVGKTKGFGLFEMISFLFSNNSLSSFMGLFFGFFFGIFPVLNAILNGLVLGFAAHFSVTENGVLSLWRLFPHGIFELPAIFISLGLGVKLSTFVFKKKKADAFRDFLEKSFWSYVLIVLPLLVIAAIIEGTLIYLGV